MSIIVDIQSTPTLQGHVAYQPMWSNLLPFVKGGTLALSSGQKLHFSHQDRQVSAQSHRYSTNLPDVPIGGGFLHLTSPYSTGDTLSQRIES
jgi:hypothetical protein